MELLNQPLRPRLKQKRWNLYSTHGRRSPHDQYDRCRAYDTLPVKPTWDRFKEKHPRQASHAKRLLKTIGNEQVAFTSSTKETKSNGGSVCTLIVEVVGCNGLQVEDTLRATLPSPYVHYHMVGHGDTMTNVVSGSYVVFEREAREYHFPYS